MSIDFEASPAEESMSSPDIADKLKAALNEGSENKNDAGAVQKIKAQVYSLRERLQDALVSELGEEAALLDDTYDQLFAEAAEFLKPPSAPASRPFRKSQSKGFKPGYDGGFAKYH